ncbi:hypothetical protein DOY81_008456 [Sarcophaga bullata]|nr:hypothetical protein DOY81_008456 [Sarcophaga bullata]
MGKFSDMFNSTTIRGRANVAKATYASIATIYILNRIRKGRKKTDSPPPTEGQEEPQEEPQVEQEAGREAGQETVKGDTHIEGNGKCQCTRCQCKTPSVKAEDKTSESDEKLNGNVPEAETESSDGGNGEKQNGNGIKPSDIPEKPKEEIGGASAGEAIIKSAKGKCESGCGPEFVSTTNQIEQKYLRLYDEDINFWWE